MEAQGADWGLESGVWRCDSESAEWVLVARPNGQRLSDRLSPSERLTLVRTATSARGSQTSSSHYPAEFVFSPVSGERLVPAAAAASAPWIPPFIETSQITESSG